MGHLSPIVSRNARARRLRPFPLLWPICDEHVDGQRHEGIQKRSRQAASSISASMEFMNLTWTRRQASYQVQRFLSIVCRDEDPKPWNNALPRLQ